MRGHKFDYFALQLSFIGWAILACLTFGIGFLWLIPYIQLTSIEFYRYIRDEYMYKQQTLENNANMNKGWLFTSLYNFKFFAESDITHSSLPSGSLILCSLPLFLQVS